MNRPGYPSQIVPFDPVGYQKGWDARLDGERWWHFNWLEASWRAGWKDAGKELAANPELANKVAARIKRRRRAT